MIFEEAISKMQSAVGMRKDKFDEYGFVTSIETDYMNAMYKTVDDPKKAKFVTVSLVIGKQDGKAGDEYCMSLGAQITHRSIDDARLEQDILNFEKMVSEAIEILEKYDSKDDGLDFLTAKASEEYEKFLKKMEEERAKSRRIALIGNIVFIVGIPLLFIVAFLK